jgi:hypothetical protein
VGGNMAHVQQTRTAAGPVSHSTEKGPRKPYVRVVTDKRREQNRKAQKAYRERLKKKLEDLEEQAAAVAPRVDELNSADSASDSHLEDDAEAEAQRSNQRNRINSPPDSESRSTRNAPDTSYTTSRSINLADAFAAAGDLPFGQGLIPSIQFQVARTPEPSEPEFHADCFHGALGDFGDVDMHQIWAVPESRHAANPKYPSPPQSTTGSRTSMVLTPRRPLKSPRPDSNFADPYVNHVRLVGEGNIEAALSIGLALKISRSQYINDHPSHFPTCYVTLNKTDPSHPLSLVARNSVTYKVGDKHMTVAPALMEHLESISQPIRPTPAQLLNPHPTYLDCIVFPHFREHAVRASAEGILDHGQLFMDLMHGGLVCWGGMSGLSNRHGRSSKSAKRDMRDNVAWSSRSWEAKKWFLRKWTWLVGTQEEEEARGDTDGIWASSRWWWSMRGVDDSEDEEDDEDGFSEVRVSEVDAGGGHCL